MRLLVVKQASNLQSLSSQLLDGGSKPAANSAARTAALESVKLLNPHVDFRHIEAGTVLALPDSPEFKDSQVRSIDGDAFASFANDATDGLNAIAQRVGGRIDALTSDHDEFTAVLKTGPVQNAVLLRTQLSNADHAFDSEQKKAQSAAMQLKAMKQAIEKELRALGSLVR